MTLGACLTDEVVSGTEIKKNNNGVSVQGERTSEDLLAFRNIFEGSVVDATGLHNSHLLRTMWWMGDMALRGSLLWRGALSSKMDRATTIEAGVAGGDSSGQWCRQAYHKRRWR
jgi:hypothetical protein